MKVTEFLNMLSELERQYLYTIVIPSTQESIKFDNYCRFVPNMTQESFTYWCDRLIQNAYIDQARYDELMLQCPTDTDPGSYAVNP